MFLGQNNWSIPLTQGPSRQVFVKTRNLRIYSGSLRTTPCLPEPFVPAELASEDPKLLATAVTEQKWKGHKAW